MAAFSGYSLLITTYPHAQYAGCRCFQCPTYGTTL